MKPLFCGNLDSDTSESDLEKLFSRYGKVVKVKLKSGFTIAPGLCAGLWSIRGNCFHFAYVYLIRPPR